MKRIFALMLALLMACSLVACSDKDDDESEFDITVTDNELVYKPENSNDDAFYYEYINDDEVSIVGYTGSHVPHAITVPAAIDNRPVTNIAAGAFNSKSNITAVSIPDSVAAIGDYAFNDCVKLATVTLPSTLVSLGDAVFANCAALTAVNPVAKEGAQGVTVNTLPASIEEFGVAVFYNCEKLESMALPQTMTVMPKQTFMGCKALACVEWSSNGTLISDYALMGCVALQSINLPTTLTAIGDYAFAGCSALSALSIPAATKAIGISAFNACIGLANVTFAKTEWFACKNAQADDNVWREVDVTTSDSAIRNLTDTYDGYYWKLIVSQ